MKFLLEYFSPTRDKRESCGLPNFGLFIDGNEKGINPK
jgi:hypothetical protein